MGQQHLTLAYWALRHIARLTSIMVLCCSCLLSTWRVLSADLQSDAATTLVPALCGLMTAPGIPWASWLGVVTLAAALIEAAGQRQQDTDGALLLDCLPLASGLVHVLDHSTVSQVRCFRAAVLATWVMHVLRRLVCDGLLPVVGQSFLFKSPQGTLATSQ